MKKCCRHSQSRAIKKRTRPTDNLQAVFSTIVLVIFICGPGWPAQILAADLTAKDILDRVDDLYRGDSSHGTMTMTINTEHWTRTLSIEFWSKGKENSLMRILAPKKEKDTATLRSGNNIWNYLPKVNRTIKLPSSMMASSWMGSHFTNDDLVKESRMADDYTFEISFRGTRDETELVEITCIPRPEAAVVWGKVTVTVKAADYMPLQILYYDEDLKLARTMSFMDIGPIGDRTLPRLMTMVPTDKPKESTVVQYHEMTFNPELDDQLFSLRSLQR